VAPVSVLTDSGTVLCETVLRSVAARMVQSMSTAQGAASLTQGKLDGRRLQIPPPEIPGIHFFKMPILCVFLHHETISVLSTILLFWTH